MKKISYRFLFLMLYFLVPTPTSFGVETQKVLFDHFDLWSWHEDDRYPGKFTITGSNVVVFSTRGYGFYTEAPPFGLSYFYTPFKETKGELETKVRYKPEKAEQVAGMVVIVDKKNYFVFGITSREREGEKTGTRVILIQSIDTKDFSILKEETVPVEAPKDDTWYLKMTKDGDKWQAFYGTDGKTWKEIGTTKQAQFGGNILVGVTAYDASKYPVETKAYFDSFEIRKPK